MNRKAFVFVLSLGVLLAWADDVHSQPVGRGESGRMGPGMMGGYGEGNGSSLAPGNTPGNRFGMAYGMGPGRMGGWVHVPDRLPTPRNPEWLQRLKDILALERESLAQYRSDQERFQVPMPYGMVIPQEANHIRWIEGLLKAYGLTSPATSAPVLIRNGTLTEAYKVATKMEADLLPRYEWLVRNAEDGDTAQVLNVILLQSRWHLALFEHALRMGQGFGFRRGDGMMGGSDAGF